MKKVFGYLAPHKGRIAYGLSLKFIGTVAELVLPMVMAYMIDEVAPTGSVRAILLWGGVMLACAVAAFACNVVANRSASRVARDSTRALRGDLFAKTLSLSARQADEVTVPSLVSRLSSDTYNIHTMIGMIQRLGIRTPIMLVGGVALTFFVEPVLALVLLATVPVLSLIVVFISRRGIVLYTALQRASDGMVRKVRDDYTGMRVIKALSKTECESRSFAEVNAELSRRAQRAALTTGITNPLLNALLNLGMVAVIAVGAYRVAAGKAMVGEIIAFTSYFTIILNAVISISRIFDVVTRGTASARRVEDVLARPRDLLPDPDASGAPGRICFDRVSFGYGGAPVLKDISFTVEAGESLGVIGATGSGKSTLAALLLRFYDADSGTVSVDGKNVRAYEEEELRKKFGVVLQNDFLMAASIRENIDFERGLGDEAIRAAAQTAQAAPFIEENEAGYGAMLTARGSNLSGGQKQRVLIARALAASPEILLLDDSSGALDYKTDARLRKAIRSRMQGTTIVMIAQRISSVRFADHILVLDEGRAVGYGTDEKLRRTCPVYRSILRSQTGEVDDAQ